MERLLHYVWQHRLYPLGPLCTTRGVTVEVVNPGLPNTDAGPDFFNAQVKMGGQLLVGNVEIHTVSTEWFRHGHDHDPRYDNVILHVVERDDGPVTTRPGRARCRQWCRREPRDGCRTVPDGRARDGGKW